VIALAYLALAAAMAIVGVYVGFSKALVVIFPVFVLAWLRFGIAGVAMAPWLRRGAGERPLDGREKRLLFLLSFFGNFLFSICMLAGIERSSALAAGVIMAAIPAAVAVLSWRLLGERVAPRTWAGVACAVAGIGLVAFARDAEGELASGSLVGAALLLGACVCEALYVVIGKKLTGTVPPKRISALINAWGLLLVTPLAVWQWVARGFDPRFVPGQTWGLLVLYAILASVVTVLLWMKGMQRVPASRAGVFTVFLPIAAALVGWSFLGESFTAMQVVAFGLAIAGVVLATWPGRGPAPETGTPP
jgi:drug/metabolite transporter (DMT)-like permease